MRSRARGVALIVAVLLVALATLIVAALIDSTDLALARTRNALRAQQAQEYARGIEVLALKALARDQEQEQGVDAIDDVWARGLPPFEVPGGLISGQIRERNGCFNINLVVTNGQRDEIGARRFERLLRALKLDPRLLDAVVDFADSDAESSPGGAEDLAYLQTDPPRRSANQPYRHESELRLVRGIDDAVFRKLAPHVCAHARSAAINLNTATAPVWMALVDGLDENRARQLNNDGKAHLASVDAYLGQLQQIGMVFDGGSDGLSVGSVDFLAEGVVELDSVPFRFAITIERTRDGHRVVARSRSSL